METTVQYREQIQYAEVYISDMLTLKNLFLQTEDIENARNFGIPFLLAEKQSEIIAFASLVLHKKDKISLRVYAGKGMSESEKKNFTSRAEAYFIKNNTPNFRNPEQLRSSISNMVDWLFF